MLSLSQCKSKRKAQRILKVLFFPRAQQTAYTTRVKCPAPARQPIFARRSRPGPFGTAATPFRLPSAPWTPPTTPSLIARAGRIPRSRSSVTSSPRACGFALACSSRRSSSAGRRQVGGGESGPVLPQWLLAYAFKLPMTW
jgi:hypothetical protein